MPKTFFSFPAYDVVEGSVDALDTLSLNAGDELALINNPYRQFQIGSVVSYAMKNGDDPILAIDRARELGHDLHFIFALGTCIHNGPIEKKTYIGVELGQHVKFEGRTFTVESAPNGNLKLRECI